MRRVLLAFVVCLCLSATLRAQLYPKEWATEGLKTNPVAANTVLAQYVNENPSGETHYFHILCVASVTGTVFLEHMDSTNATAIRSQVLQFAPVDPFESKLPMVITLDSSERFRIRSGNAILIGNIQCSIWAM